MLMLLIGIALSGCTSSKDVRQDLLHIPQNGVQDFSNGKFVVYGVAFKHLDNSLNVIKFGMQPVNNDTIKVKYGPSYFIYYDNLKPSLWTELNIVLNRQGFDSLETFTEKYESVEPIMPKSFFKALPENLGKSLHGFAKKHDRGMKPVDWRSGR